MSDYYGGFQNLDQAAFAMQAAQNQAAAESAAAARYAADLAAKTAEKNISFLKEQSAAAQAALAPFQQLGLTNSKALLDAVGVNGVAAQQAIQPFAKSIQEQHLQTTMSTLSPAQQQNVMQGIRAGIGTARVAAGPAGQVAQQAYTQGQDVGAVGAGIAGQGIGEAQGALNQFGGKAIQAQGKGLSAAFNNAVTNPNAMIQNANEQALRASQAVTGAGAAIGQNSVATQNVYANDPALAKQSFDQFMTAGPTGQIAQNAMATLQRANNNGGDPSKNINKFLNSLTDPINGAVTQFQNGPMVQRIMDAANKYGMQAVENSAAARGQLNSGATLAQLHEVGTSNFGQFMMPYINSISQNILQNGVGMYNANNANAVTNLGTVIQAGTAGMANHSNIVNQAGSVGANVMGQNASLYNSAASNNLSTQVGLVEQAGTMGANLQKGYLDTGVTQSTQNQNQLAHLFSQNQSNATNLIDSGITSGTNLSGQLATNLSGQSTSAINNAISTGTSQYSNQYGQNLTALASGQGAGVSSANTLASVFGNLGNTVAAQNTYGADVRGQAAMSAANAFGTARINNSNIAMQQAMNRRLPATGQSLSGMLGI